MGVDDVTRPLAGRVAVVTGASRNIGAALVAGLARAGAEVVAVARGEELVRSVAADVTATTGQTVHVCVADVATPDGVEKVGLACRDLGGVDVLVNNAASAGTAPGPVLEQSEEDWDAVWATNVMAPLRLTRALWPMMRTRPGANVVNVVSGSGFLPSPGIGAYAVSKAALWMLTRQLAVELAPDIRVNALCPGLTSPDGEPAHPAHEALLPLVPMGRLARPEEMVGAVLYLVSDAASYTTGEVIFVNGGRPW